MDIEDGGLKMVDVKSMFKALRVKWTQRYSDGNLAAWEVLFNEFTAPYGRELLFYCNVNYKQVKSWNNVPLFYKDMFNAYFDLVQPDKIDIASQCIWNNQHICIDKMPCFYKHLLDKGIKLVSDLFFCNGKIIHFKTWVNRGVQNKYFLHWRGIISAIPVVWKNILKEGFASESQWKEV